MNNHQIRDLERITFDSQIMAGQACIRGMRIPVSLIVNLVANDKPLPFLNSLGVLPKSHALTLGLHRETFFAGFC